MTVDGDRKADALYFDAHEVEPFGLAYLMEVDLSRQSGGRKLVV
jgi:hypothetical protein